MADGQRQQLQQDRRRNNPAFRGKFRLLVDIDDLEVEPPPKLLVTYPLQVPDGVPRPGRAVGHSRSR